MTAPSADTVRTNDALQTENDELRARLQDLLGFMPELAQLKPDHAPFLDPRIEQAQIAARNARDALINIAKVTGGMTLLDISERLAKAHDGLYKVNRELRELRAALSAVASTAEMKNG